MKQQLASVVRNLKSGMVLWAAAACAALWLACNQQLATLRPHSHPSSVCSVSFCKLLGGFFLQHQSAKPYGLLFLRTLRTPYSAVFTLWRCSLVWVIPAPFQLPHMEGLVAHPADPICLAGHMSSRTGGVSKVCSQPLYVGQLEGLLTMPMGEHLPDAYPANQSSSKLIWCDVHSDVHSDVDWLACNKQLATLRPHSHPSSACSVFFCKFLGEFFLQHQSAKPCGLPWFLHQGGVHLCV